MLRPQFISFIYLLLVFIYRPHVRSPRSGRQVRKSGAQTNSRVFRCASDRSYNIERQVCSLSTKPQVSTTLHYTITVCCNRTAHSQHRLPASVLARELNLKYARATGELNPGSFAPAVECVSTRPSRPLFQTLLRIHYI